MPRYFAPITVKQLENKISEAIDADPYGGNPKNLTKQVRKDLDKVEFDMENYGDDYGGYINCPTGKKSLSGYHTLDNGFTFYGCMAGGDWESPILFIVYWDGKMLRGYIPSKGNTWNTINKSALGNDEDKDLAFLRKRFPQEYELAKKNQANEYWEGAFAYQYKNEIPFNYKLLVEDIKARILPIP